MREVELGGTMIRLGQFLKLAGLVENGGEAKDLLGAGGVTVNGEREDRRGRQLHDGDVVIRDQDHGGDGEPVRCRMDVPSPPG